MVLEGRVIGRDVNRLAADFAVQIPRLTQLVKAWLIRRFGIT